jgi:hypothetical protein
MSHKSKDKKHFKSSLWISSGYDINQNGIKFLLKKNSIKEVHCSWWIHILKMERTSLLSTRDDGADNNNKNIYFWSMGATE